MARKPKSNGSVTVTRKTNSIDPFDGQQTLSRRKSPSNTNLSLSVELTPKTEPQRQMIEAYCQGLNVIAVGAAGSGKSICAVALALQDLIANRVGKIYIVRSTVQVRNFGFVPGTTAEKIEPFALPYKAMVNEMLGCGTAWETLTKKGLIEFTSTTFMRGITLKNAVVILDEFQDTDFSECETVITRMGNNTRLIIIGDMKQSDLHRYKEKSGYHEVLETIKKMPKYFEVVNFLPEDCVRSGMVREWLLVRETM